MASLYVTRAYSFSSLKEEHVQWRCSQRSVQNSYLNEGADWYQEWPVKAILDAKRIPWIIFFGFQLVVALKVAIVKVTHQVTNPHENEHYQRPGKWIYICEALLVLGVKKRCQVRSWFYDNDWVLGLLDAIFVLRVPCSVRKDGVGFARHDVISNPKSMQTEFLRIAKAVSIKFVLLVEVRGNSMLGK